MVSTIIGRNPSRGSHIQKTQLRNVPVQLWRSAVDRL